MFKDKQALLEEDHIIIVKGKCSISEEKCSIIADEIYNIDDGINRLIKNLTIHIEVDSQLTIIDKLKQLFLSNKGNIPVTFEVKKHDNYVVHLAIDSKYHVKASIPFFEKLSQLVGDKNFCYDNVIIRREDVAGINHSFV